MPKPLMRFRGGRRVGAWWFVAALSLVALACSADKEKARGQLMLALQTDMELPKDVSSVRILVLVNGAPRFDRSYPVGPEGAKIPATLAIVAGDDPSTPVEIKVLAFRESEVRTLNRTITTIPESRIALLRVPIEWLCDGFVAGSGEEDGEYVSSCAPDGDRERACSGGECRDVEVRSKDLPTFRAADVFGGGTPSGGGVCFPVQRCFDDGFSVAPNAACRVELETDPEAPLNFALIPANGDGACSEDTNTCYVPLDQSTLGWVELDPPSDGRRLFELPAAVCARLEDGSALALRGTTACDTKTLATPPCGPGSSVDEPLEPGEEFPVTPVDGEGGAGGQQGGAGGVPSEGGAGGVHVTDGGAGGGGVLTDGGAGGGVLTDGGAGGEGNTGGSGADLPCDPNPCANGTCIHEGDVSVCDCFAGFEGDRCETAVGSLTGTGFVDGGLSSHAMATNGTGEFVVGYGTNAEGVPVAFVWSAASGATALPDLSSVTGSTPFAISADGSTVVGASFLDDGTQVAVKWDLVGSQALAKGEVTVPVGGTVMVMGPTALGAVDPYIDSIAHDVSADGSVIVGTAGIESGAVPFKWTEATGMLSLGFPGSAVAVSDDGSAIACNGEQGAVFWREGHDPVQLGALNEGTTTATDISGDGRIIVGVTPYEHFRWSLEDGVDSGYGQLSESSLTDISSNYDGSVLVGKLNAGEAAVWDEANGWRYLRDALAEGGIVFDTWYFNDARGVSADGSLLVGIAQDPNELTQGFVVRLPLTVNVNECDDTDPCLAGGSCSELIVGYACDCPAGHAGRNCGLLEVSPLPNGNDPNVNALSADGSVYAGASQDAYGYVHATLWTSPTSAEDLGVWLDAFYASATGISADGSVVVGESGSEAFRWTRAGSIVGLGFIPGATSQYSYAAGVSADGTAVVGYGYNSSGNMEAFRWTEAGMLALGFLPNMTTSQAQAVSADGSVVVGHSGIADNTQAFRWTAAGMVELTMPEPTTWASAYGVSADGSVVVGSFERSIGTTGMFRWTQASGAVALNAPPGSTDISAQAVSADGSVIIGYASNQLRSDPIVWRASHGVVYLRDVLRAAGIDPAGLHLDSIHALSSDGTVVTGTGADTFNGRRIAWLVELPR